MRIINKYAMYDLNQGEAKKRVGLYSTRLNYRHFHYSRYLLMPFE